MWWLVGILMGLLVILTIHEEFDRWSPNYSYREYEEYE